MSEKRDEDESFQKIRLTLSEIAIEKLAELRNRGYFRSDSSTVEECIRIMYDVSNEFSNVVDQIKDPDAVETLPLTEQAIILQRIGLRASRFIRPPKVIKRK